MIQIRDWIQYPFSTFPALRGKLLLFTFTEKVMDEFHEGFGRGRPRDKGQGLYYGTDPDLNPG